jgi:hypothetical protein
VNPAAALAALALGAAQPDPDAPPPPAPSGAQPAPPTIDSLLDQPPISEDARAAAVRAAFDAAQARRGSLDGRWRLAAKNGGALFLFQFSDPGQIPDPRSANPRVPVIEGSWMDAFSSTARNGSGFLTSVERSGDALTLRFDISPDPRRERVVVLHRQSGGDWVGDMMVNGAPQPVVMRRD